MGTFTLDTSTLAGGQFATRPFDLVGEFREIQFQMTQSSANQDMEVHFLEFHFVPSGLTEDSR